MSKASVKVKVLNQTIKRKKSISQKMKTTILLLLIKTLN